MEQILKVFQDQVIVSNLLTFLLILSGLIVYLFNLSKKFDKDVVSKIAGVFLVTGLAIAANNYYVYGMSIFIIATIITKLDFLENLAAIFSKDAHYWNYKIAVNNATKEEVRKKATEELSETDTSNKKPVTDDQISILPVHLLNHSHL
jgi:hypothetical protein